MNSMEGTQPSDLDLEDVSDDIEFWSNCSGPSSVKNNSVTTTESSLSSITNLLQRLKSPTPSKSPRKRVHCSLPPKGKNVPRP